MLRCGNRLRRGLHRGGIGNRKQRLCPLLRPRRPMKRLLLPMLCESLVPHLLPTVITDSIA
jgi:hypothetical protein